jgi:hypothetical protein
MDILFERLKQLASECPPSPPSSSVSVGVLEVSASCEKIGVTVSTPGSVGLFGGVAYQFSQRFRRLSDPRERFIEKQAGRDPDVALNLPGYGGAFDGQVTVSAGAQAGVSGPGGVGAGAKISGETTFNNQGDMTGSRGTFSVSASGPTGTGIGAGTSWSSSPGAQ